MKNNVPPHHTPRILLPAPPDILQQIEKRRQSAKNDDVLNISSLSEEAHDRALAIFNSPDYEPSQQRTTDNGQRQGMRIPRPAAMQENMARKRQREKELKAERQSTATPFELWPKCKPVTRAFRELLIATYPALDSIQHAPALQQLLVDHPELAKSHSDTRAYWRIMQYVLFSGAYEIDTGRLLFSREIVTSLVEIPVNQRDFAALHWIEAFSQDVLRLNVVDYVFTESKARTIDPEDDPAIRAAMQSGMATGRDRNDHTVELVDLVTGVSISGRAQRLLEKQHRAERDQMFAAVDKNHPAFELLKFLHEDNGRYLTRVLRRNWPNVQRMANTMPESTDAEKARKRHCLHLLARIDPNEKIHYTAVQNTSRIYADGASLHQLPREIRQAALAGGVELDLQSCQLAVVAEIWNIPELQRFLRSGRSIWTELLNHTVLGPEHKPAIKTTIYSILFGMGVQKLKKQLAEGDRTRHLGIGHDAMELFFEHSLIKAILRARNWQRKIIRKNRGGYDAFGRFQTIPRSNRRRIDGMENRHYDKPNVPAALAAIVQSYELKLMLSLLPDLNPKQQVYLLSWLHDGVTVHFGNKTKQRDQIRRMQKKVSQAAQEMGVSTQLEVTPLSNGSFSEDSD